MIAIDPRSRAAAAWPCDAADAALAHPSRADDEPYRLTVELNNQVLWLADEDSIGPDKRWAGITDLLASSASGGCGLASVHPDDAASVDRRWHAARRHAASFDVEFRLWMPNYAYRWHRARAAPQPGAGHGVRRWYGTIEDVEDRRQADIRLQTLQAELIHMSRLSAMGAMASTLAHELNQPLTATANFLRGCRRLVEQDRVDQRATLVDAIARADQSVARAGDIIRRLRDMTARRGVERRPENLAALIREACALALIDGATRGVGCYLDIPDDTVMVDVDRIQIEQVVINLLRNALEAVDGRDGGEIAIAARSVDGVAEIVVRDNGPGIPDATRARLFDAFNSSKADAGMGGGMGVGLSISRTIVELHGGRIAHEPSQNTGTAIRFTLPTIKRDALL